MSVHLLIDGYNVLHRMGFGVVEFEVARDTLIDLLASYKKQGGARISLVFDAYQGFSLDRTKENHRGVEVIFSRRDETADDVIRERIRRKESGLVVVSSDRAIIEEAKRHGVAFLTADRLEALMTSRDNTGEDALRPDKRGNARKLPKSVRRARRTIGKI